MSLNGPTKWMLGTRTLALDDVNGEIHLSVTGCNGDTLTAILSLDQARSFAIQVILRAGVAEHDEAWAEAYAGYLAKRIMEPRV